MHLRLPRLLPWLLTIVVVSFLALWTSLMGSILYAVVSSADDVTACASEPSSAGGPRAGRADCPPAGRVRPHAGLWGHGPLPPGGGRSYRPSSQPEDGADVATSRWGSGGTSAGAGGSAGSSTGSGIMSGRRR